MKLIAITILSFVAAGLANPVSVSNNNIGDIVTIGVNANAVLSSNIDQNIVTVIAALLNQQAIGVVTGSLDHAIGQDAATNGNESPKLPEFNISPEMIEKVKNQISPELIEKFKNFLDNQ